jgi:membrane protein DedA with SNARE-associated domain
MGLVEWGIDLVMDWIQTHGYGAIVFLMALESACMPVPSEIVMPFAGALVYEGEQAGYIGSPMSLIGVTLAGALGCTIGSILAYVVGLYAGRPFIVKYGKYILLKEKHLVTAEKWFAKYGDKATFIARLLPVVRTVISLPAGIAKMDFKKFVFYSFVGSVPWTFMLAYIGYYLGPSWRDIESVFRYLDILVVAGAVVLVVWYVRRMRKERDADAKAQP